MKKLLVSAALGLGLLAGPSMAEAIEFNASGEWIFGFGAVDASFLHNNNGDADTFNAQQRIRLYLDATVSEALSGTVGFTIGETNWGNAGTGGQLGTDGVSVAVRDAYLDWFVPGTKLQFRMGLQGVANPNAAGGAAILDDQVAGIVASYQATDMVGVTAFWLRPLNDNFGGINAQERFDAGSNINTASANVFDNVDYFGIIVPITTETLEITPWAMIGMVGKNAVSELGSTYSDKFDGDPLLGNVTKAYGTQYYFGVPVVFSGLAPFNIEFDLNYGYSENMGSNFTVGRDIAPGAGVQSTRNAHSQRAGWLVKALFEYEMEWGTPGLVAWYASGDDGSVSNGSERMPSISPASNFTSFIQDGDTGWSVNNGFDLMLEYGGTWGLGLQVKELSFMENLSHNLRVVYWGGTNSTTMIKHYNVDNLDAQRNITEFSSNGWKQDGAFYLTTVDYLVEVNVDSSYAIYDNLTAIVELGYIFNGVNKDAWNSYGVDGRADAKKDAWKAALILKYEF